MDFGLFGMKTDQLQGDKALDWEIQIGWIKHSIDGNVRKVYNEVIGLEFLQEQFYTILCFVISAWNY